MKPKAAHILTSAVVGIERSQEFLDRADALRIAFMTDYGLFLFSGKVALTGSVPEQQEWMEWADMLALDEHGSITWIDPYEQPRIIEAVAEDVVFGEGETLQFLSSVNDWVYVPQVRTGSLYNAFYIRTRAGNILSPATVPLETITKKSWLLENESVSGENPASKWLREGNKPETSRLNLDSSRTNAEEKE